MIKNIKDKISSKKGSEMVQVLIVVVILSAAAFFVTKGLGTSSKSAGTAAQTQITDTTSDASSFATTGAF